MKNIALFTLTVLLLLTGCNKKNNDSIKELESPIDVSIAFFDALYNEKNLKKAASVCTPKLARIISHYKSPKAVARHVFNMPYDHVIITPDDSGVKVREMYRNKAIITLFFEGEYNGNTLKDVKKISLKQVNGAWIIDKILKDPF